MFGQVAQNKKVQPDFSDNECIYCQMRIRFNQLDTILAQKNFLVYIKFLKKKANIKEVLVVAKECSIISLNLKSIL